MAIRTVFKYRNIDSTKDYNDRWNGLFVKGIYQGGTLSVVPGELSVDVAPFKLIGFDGMAVFDETEVTRLPVVAGQTNVVCFRSRYFPTQNPWANWEVLELSQYQAHPEKNYLTVFASLELDALAIEALPEQIDHRLRDELTPPTRLNYRGVFAAAGLLPGNPRMNRHGDFAVVIDGVTDPAIYVWSDITFNWFASSGGSGGGGAVELIFDANADVTVSDKSVYIVRSNTATLNFTLPVTTPSGFSFTIIDGVGNFATIPALVQTGGRTIDHAPGPFRLNCDFGHWEFVSDNVNLICRRTNIQGVPDKHGRTSHYGTHHFRTGASSAPVGFTAAGSDSPSMGYNFHGTTTSGSYSYTTNGPAFRMQFNQSGRPIRWLRAPSGTANAVITWTEAFYGTDDGRWVFNTKDSTTDVSVYAVGGISIGEVNKAATVAGPQVVRWNSTVQRHEFSDGVEWKTLGGGGGTVSTVALTDGQERTFTLSADSKSYDFSAGYGDRYMKCFADYASDAISILSDPSAIGLIEDVGVGLYVRKAPYSAGIIVKNKTGGAITVKLFALNNSAVAV